ncbi:MAG TPA: hypothetical protein VG538_09110 [Vicinamibacterales bacterium]|nr:hypothetical protein [Vicinamibacterales bacterium]
MSRAAGRDRGPLPLLAALERGAVVVAVNWPVVLVDLAIESFYELALAVPIVGGAVMGAALMGADVGDMLRAGLPSTADVVIGSLAAAPEALVSFLAAVAVVAFGGEALMAIVKAGTLHVIVVAERRLAAGRGWRGGTASLAESWAWSLRRVRDGIARFGRRMLALALALAVADFVVGVAYLATLGASSGLAADATWTAAWPLAVVAATSVGVVLVAAIKLTYDLLRVVILTDDCGVGDARRRLARFVMADARQVIGIFSVLGCVTVVATMLSVLAAAGLAVVAWMPFASVIVVPLQLAAWIVRGLIFEYFALSAVSAYQTQYRRFSAAEGTIAAERSTRSTQLVLVDDDGAIDGGDGEKRHPPAVGGDGNRLE